MQTGKSYALNQILPALVSCHDSFGVVEWHELLICQLNFEAIAGDTSYERMLRGLLLTLLKWASAGQVRILPKEQVAHCQQCSAFGPSL
jgi:hypothetical protein